MVSLLLWSRLFVALLLTAKLGVATTRAVRDTCRPSPHCYHSIWDGFCFNFV